MDLLTTIATFMIAGIPFLHSADAVPVQPSALLQEQPIAQVVDEEKVTNVIVRPGDSLSKIAKKYDTTWKRIYDANKNIKHPDVINPGDKIRIPGSSEELKERSLPEGTAKTESQSVNSSTTSKTAKSYPAVGNGVWDRLAQCESGGNWSINSGNGYYGGLQFTLSTWRSVGGSGYPHQASREEQIAGGKILQARSGWGQWPACAAKLGLL